MSSNKLNSTGVVILAAGRGSRLNCTDKPKVMCEIGGRPIVSYIIDTLKKCGFTKENICLVVGFHQEKIREYFGDEAIYASQEELKGTAHAAYVGMQKLPLNIKTVLVINGDDSAFYSTEAILDLLTKHQQSKAVVSVLSVELEDPSSYGRIIKYEDGRVEIIEKEYLTDEQKNIKEISSGTFCFDRNWFETMFPTMLPLRKLGEYGLPTALAVANKDNLGVQVIKLKNNSEWFGVNTPAELAEADKRKLTL
ncbi:MAG: bifunctional UDP-N-acetylglucosamine pyrophosphorylase / Glucosamine-1-phosphate N-acetyltransferase [Parcubacteria group bacterium Gr01-1014_13]|nr:MAG: bifunctional UDP-N-acetylglucosamine pyrophosphorylase / Glucosamine-1-phosphate N-acetyltransferase [Parcubacteria group bacterium Gr01-1014_13]